MSFTAFRLRFRPFLLILGVMFACLGSAIAAPFQTESPTPAPTPTLTEAQKKLVTNAEAAVRSANLASDHANQARRLAAGHANRLTKLTAFETADRATLDRFEEINDIVGLLSESTFLEEGENNFFVSDLTKAKGALTTSCAALPSGDDIPPEIGRARNNCESASTGIEATIRGINLTRGQLDAALESTYGSGKRFIALMKGRLKRVSPIAGVATASEDPAAVADRLMRNLPRQLPVFAEVEQLRRDFRDEWKKLAESLSAVPGNTHHEPDAGTEGTLATLEGFDDEVNAVLVRLTGWFTTLTGFAQGRATALEGKVQEVRLNPVAKSSEAYEAAREGTVVIGGLRQINNAWLQLAAQLPDPSNLPGSPTSFDLEATSRSARVLNETSRRLNFATTDLQDAVTGDFSEFEADQVSLFYFTDVPRLMQILNPSTFEVGGVTGASEQAANERRKLSEADLDLVEAQGEVSAAQTRVVALREQMRQSQAAADGSRKLFRTSTLNVKEAERDFNRTDQKFNKAKTEFEASPNDPEKRAAFDRAAEGRDRDEARLRESRERNEEIDEDRKAAEDRNNALKDEQRGLPDEIQKAEARLAAAQAAVNRQRKTALLSAQAESEAFVRARDNRPYWYAPAIGSSTDPAKRVLMWAFNDSKTVFLRGTRKDLAQVKCIIAKLDKPSPQARMTLWTLELSSDASTRGTKKFNQGLQIVENQLSNTRAQVASALSLLRDTINDEVNRVAAGKIGVPTHAFDYRLARLHFYHPEVLLRLGFNPTQPNDPELVQRTIPDPAGTTTLGEALMVLSLGRRESRNWIIENFVNRLPLYLQSLGLNERPTASVGEGYWFSSTRRALSLDMDVLGLSSAQAELTGGLQARSGAGISRGVANATQTRAQARTQAFNPSDVSLTSSQTEILHAMEEVAYQRALDYFRELYLRYEQINARLAAPRPRDEAAKMSDELDRKAYDAESINIQKRLLPLLDRLRRKSGLTVEQITSDSGVLREKLTRAYNIADPVKRQEELAIVNEEWLSNKARRACNNDPLRTANARVAAADQMLKDIIIAMEDDLDRHFVRPTMDHMRRLLTDQAGIGVGIIQRTSVLATNRLQARVDPRSSAQLPLGKETDILQAAQELAQIYLSTQTGGALAALGALNALPRKQDGELYGLTTGNLFQVTPIFDPSGQALRFKFDFVGSSQIREPDGTVNPQLPRIERHTVNTEVQISNLELREVSRFDSNSRLGLATRYSGGLPIFRDIPGVRYVPLIGWFVRRSGKAAVTQQSLIFGQTTMYPTIGDIMDLLTTTSPLAEAAPAQPAPPPLQR